MIGNRLRQLRKTLGLSQRAFAVKTGINYVTVSKYENSEINMGLNSLVKLATTFQVNMNWLFYGDGDIFRKPELNTVKHHLNDTHQFIKHSLNDQQITIKIDLNAMQKSD